MVGEFAPAQQLRRPTTHFEFRSVAVGDDNETMGEDEAVRLWERAADLARAAEVAKATAMATRIDAPTRPPGQAASGGYALAHVRSAALEAGIAPEFVDAAVADYRAEQVLSQTGTGSAFVRWFLDNPPDTITARRVVAKPAHEVLAAMEALFLVEPYRLLLVERRGDVLAGGTMVFDIHSNASPFNPGFGYQMRDSGVRQLAVALHPIAGDVSSCEVTIHGRVSSQVVSTGLGLLLSSLAGAAGTAVGLVAGVAVAGLGVSTGIVPLLVIGGAAMGGAGGTKGFRALYRRSMHNGTRALEGLLDAIAGLAQGGWLGG